MQVTARSVSIEHSPEGTSVELEDPSYTELAAMGIIAATILGALYLKFRKK